MGRLRLCCRSNLRIKTIPEMLTTTLHCVYISDIPPLITARFIYVYLYLNRCVASEASEVALAGRVLSGHHWRTRIAAWTQSSRPYGALRGLRTASVRTRRLADDFTMMALFISLQFTEISVLLSVKRRVTT